MNYKLYRKRTLYTPDKTTKMNNFVFLNKNYCKNNQTVLLGDSITEMYTHTELFAQYTADTNISVYNRGISGDTSDRILERLNDTVLNIKPKNIVLLVGTNDLGAGATPQLINENIAKIIQVSKSTLPQVNFILLAVYPVNNNLSRGVGRRRNKSIAELNGLLKQTANDENVNFVDMTDALADSNGCLNAKYTYDGLHINAQAFKLVTDRIIPLLKK